jgi:hypothetical protein
VTLLLFWLEYLPRHDPWGTVLHIILVVLSIWEFVLLYWLAATPLRGAAQGQIFPWRKAMVGAAVSSGILSLLSVGAIYGLPAYFARAAKAQPAEKMHLLVSVGLCLFFMCLTV